MREFRDFALRGNVIDLAIAWILFLVVKAANRMRKAEAPPAPPRPSAEEAL